MPASDAIARCTVRLECFADGRSSVGTSFLFRVDREVGEWIPILVTNRHVVSGFASARVTVTLAEDVRNARPEDRRTMAVQSLQEVVVYHPDQTVDLAAVFLGPFAHLLSGEGRRIELTAVRYEEIVDEDTERQMRFVEDILVVGYPQGLWDDHRNLPLFRIGITSYSAIFDYRNEPKIFN